MIRIGAPDDIKNFYYTDDNNLILLLHQAGFHPLYKENSCVYFKKSNKLIKFLKKKEIDLLEN